AGAVDAGGPGRRLHAAGRGDAAGPQAADVDRAAGAAGQAPADRARIPLRRPRPAQPRPPATVHQRAVLARIPPIREDRRPGPLALGRPGRAGLPTRSDAAVVLGESI